MKSSYLIGDFITTICPACKNEVRDTHQCPNCHFLISDQTLDEHVDESLTPFTNDSSNIRFYSLPIMACIGFVCAHSFLSFILQYFSIWVHEFGHALMSWLSGIKATPIGFGIFGMTFHSSDEKSVFVFLSFIFLMSFAFFSSKKHQTPFLGFTSLILIGLAIFFTCLVSIDKIQELIVFAGQGGEFILATLLIISFYYRLPPKWNWEHFARWPVLFIGFFTLIKISSDWLKALKTKSLNHFGGNFSEDGIAGVPGDLYRLMDEFNWSFKKFSMVYNSISLICWTLIIGHYIYFAFIHKKKSRKSQEQIRYLQLKKFKEWRRR